MSFTTLFLQGSGCAIVFLLACFLAWWGTPKMNEIARHYHLLDLPSSRKVHRQPIARLGGVAIASAAILPIIFIDLFLQCLPELAEQLSLNGSQTHIILLGGLGFFGIGLADDLLNLSAKKRLVMQFCIAAMVWAAGIRIDCSSLPSVGMIDFSLLSLPITLLWIVGLVNAMNWMDGLDGLAGGVAGIACLPLLMVAFWSQQFSLALWPAVLLGSLLGFLVFNFNPAQIFMGDGGSYFIGFMLASLSICCFLETDLSTGWLPCFLALAIPLFDMTSVMVSRLWDGRSPLIADQRHLHHRLLATGLSHKNSVLLIYGLCAVYSLLSILSFLLVRDDLGWLNFSCLSIVSLSAVWSLIGLLGKYAKSNWKGPELRSNSTLKETVKRSVSNAQSPLSV